MKRLTKEGFIKKARIVHKYNYSKVEYVNNRVEVEILCPICGSFWQTPISHLQGHEGCNCGNKKKGIKNKIYTTSIIIDKFKEIKNNINEYDYSNFIYTGMHENGVIKHNICNKEFMQCPHGHLKGQGCPDCYGTPNKGLNQFIIDANLVHNYLYTYNNFIYVDSSTKGFITCQYHGDFPQIPSNHLNGNGCPSCKQEQTESKACTFITEWLNGNSIKFEKEKRFDSCKNKNTLPFDFYLTDKNILVEYNGKQHYIESTEFKDTKLENIQFRDNIKIKWAKDNNIKLVVIKYNTYKNEKELEQILEDNLL